MLQDLHPLEKEKLLTAAEVYSLLNIGRSTWYDGVKQGIFPSPVRLGERCVRWLASDIEKLLHDAKDAPSKPHRNPRCPGMRMRKHRRKP